MRQKLVVFPFLIILLFALNSCANLENAKQDSPERGLADKATDEEARQAAEKLLNETAFIKGSDSPSLSYTLDGQYILELRDVQFTVAPRPYPANLTERANKIGWYGTIIVNANSSKKIDRLNCFSTPYADGTKHIPDDFLFISLENGKWRCDECKVYQQPLGKTKQEKIDWVNGLLKKCDK